MNRITKEIVLTSLLTVLDIVLMCSYYMIPDKTLYRIEFFLIMLKAPLFIMATELFLKTHSSFCKAAIAFVLVVLSSTMQIFLAYAFFDPGDYAFMVVFTILFLTIPLILYSFIHFIRGIFQNTEKSKKYKEKTGEKTGDGSLS